MAEEPETGFLVGGLEARGLKSELGRRRVGIAISELKGIATAGDSRSVVAVGELRNRSLKLFTSALGRGTRRAAKARDL